MKKVLITGAGGQLATELLKTKPEHIAVISLGRGDLDVTDFSAVEACIAEHEPAAIINAAAYTAVDKAEEDPKTAHAVNADAVENLAKACNESCYLLHVSTDFVFDGGKNTPYDTEDRPSPQSVYGASKWAGEQALFLHKPDSAAVIRTSWVYSVVGGNFVKSMLRFMAERESLGVVVDQTGTPTWARGLAEVCWQSVEKGLSGTYHWSDAGAASWYDFAETIQQFGLELGLLDKAIPINAIPTEAYPLPAKRPAYSVLDKRALLEALPGVQNVHWAKQLRAMLEELKLEI